MFKKQIAIFLITVGILLLNSYFFGVSNKKNKCEIDFITTEINGNSMQPLLKNKQKINFLPNYYKKCNTNPKVGDIILLDYAGAKLPLLKIIKADKNDIVYSSGLTIVINDKVMKNSVGQIYKFTKGEIDMIMFFIKDGKVEKDKYLIFGDNISNSTDSRKFGAIKKKKILGKILEKRIDL